MQLDSIHPRRGRPRPAGSREGQAYRATPLGQLVGRYVRWCRNERGLVDGTTIRDYEDTLARMSLTLADPDTRTRSRSTTSLQVIDLWADREPRTRRRSPARSARSGSGRGGRPRPATRRVRLRSPKVPKRRPDLLPAARRHAAPRRRRTDRDVSALPILLDLGVRSRARRLMVRDLDLGRRMLTVFGKGQKERVLPVRGRIVLVAESTCSRSSPSSRQSATTSAYVSGGSPSPTTTCSTRSGGRAGGHKADPKEPMPSQTFTAGGTRPAASRSRRERR